MSASSKKKLRKEQQAANMTKKQKAEKKEARKLAAYTATFWIVLILCVSIVLGLVLESPINIAIDRYGTAIKVGDHDISTTELTYFYIDAINNWYGQYGAYASYFGLNANAALDQQFYDEEAKTTWADYFLDLAMNNAKGTYALYDEAKKNGYTLSGDEKSAMDSLYADMKKQADEQNISVDKFLQNTYGASANESSYKSYYEATVMASAYYTKYAKDLKESYTPDMLRAFEGDTPYNYNSYTYASFYLNLDNFKLGGTKGSDGKVTYSEEELKAAEEYLLKVKDELSKEGIDTVEKLNAAIAEMEDKLEADKAANPVKDNSKKPEDNKTEEKPEDNKTEEKPEDNKTEEKPEDNKTEEKPEDNKTEEKPEDNKTEEKPEDNKTEEKPEDNKTEDDKKEEEDKHSKATENKKVLYSKVSSLMQEWLRNKDRKAGDITALVYESTTTGDDGKETKTLKGYYIVLFQECTDNNFALANVRHLLVKFEGGTTNSSTGQTTYTEAEKKKAKDEAEKLLKEWKDGAATEDSFAALANKHSDDGDGTTGGLYEDIYPGQMVTNFNDWCFDDARKTGDTDIVETEYGYHIMYYVSDSDENYRDYMVTNEKLEKDLTDWQKALIDAIKLEEKDLTRIDKDLVLNGGHSANDGHNH